RLLHGSETGVIVRSPEGGYSERHRPLATARAYALTARDRDPVVEAGPGRDGNGMAAHGVPVRRVRSRLSRAMFADNVQKPTAEELAEASSEHREIPARR